MALGVKAMSLFVDTEAQTKLVTVGTNQVLQQEVVQLKTRLEGMQDQMQLLHQSFSNTQRETVTWMKHRQN